MRSRGAHKGVEEQRDRCGGLLSAPERIRTSTTYSGHKAGGHPNEILAMLDAVPDLRDTLASGEPAAVAKVFDAFDVTATYDKATRQLELGATVTAELMPDAEQKRPPEGRSLMFDIAGA
jgi:hypothetical protein